MDGMWVVYLALGVVGLALAAVVVALVVVKGNRKARAQIPVLQVRATVVGTYAHVRQTGDSFTAPTVDSYNAWEEKVFSARFRLEDGTTRDFTVDKERFAGLHDGATGVLVFRGDELVDFQADVLTGSEGPPRYFFTKDTVQAGKVVKLYANAPSCGVFIEATQAVGVDFDEIGAFLYGMGAPTDDTFVVLEDDHGRVLQFSGGAPGCFMEADVPAPEQGGSFVGPAADAEAARTMVWHFLSGYDVVKENGLTLQRY